MQISFAIYLPEFSAQRISETPKTPDFRRMYPEINFLNPYDARYILCSAFTFPLSTVQYIIVEQYPDMHLILLNRPAITSDCKNLL